LKKLQDATTTNIYISSIPSNVDDVYLESVVGRFGQIQSFRIHRNTEGKAVGFFRMKSREDAENAIRALNGLLIFNHPLSARFADNEAQKRMKQNVAKKRFFQQNNKG
jgi:RNA recognition motif-containing protein